jgi:hypothetical protein
MQQPSNPQQVKRAFQTYMASLSLQSQNNNVMLRESENADKFGITPVRKPLETADQYYKDVMRMRLDVTKGLTELINDAFSASSIANQLADEELAYIANHMPSITNDMKSKFKFGLPQSALLAYLKQLFQKYTITKGVSIPAQENTLQSVVSALQRGRQENAPVNVMDDDFEPPYAVSGMQTPAQFDYSQLSQKLNALDRQRAPKTYEDLFDTLPSGAQTPAQPVNLDYSELESKLNDAKIKIIAQNLVEKIAQQSERESMGAEDFNVNKPTEAEIMQEARNLLDEIIAEAAKAGATINVDQANEIGMDYIQDATEVVEQARRGRPKKTQPTMTKRQFEDGTVDALIKWWNFYANTPGYEAMVNATPKNIVERDMDDGTLSLQPPTTGSKRAQKLKQMLKPAFDAYQMIMLPEEAPTAPPSLLPRQTTEDTYPGTAFAAPDEPNNALLNAIWTNNPPPRPFDFNAATPEQLADYRQRANQRPQGPAETPGAIQGNGMLRNNVRRFVPRNAPPIARKIHGGSLLFQPKRMAIQIDQTKGVPLKANTYVPFGKYIISQDHLNNNQLKLRNIQGGSISKLPTSSISSDLARIVKRLISGIEVDSRDIQALSERDREQLQTIVNAAKIQDRIHFNVDLTNDEAMLNRYDILLGEIVAGNDNANVVKELKGILLKLKNKGYFSMKQVTETFELLHSIGY